MKFCRECGNSLQPEQVFCTKCGARIERKSFDNVVEPQPPTQTLVQETIPIQKVNRKPMKKGTKILLGIGIGILLLLAGAYKGLDIYYDPIKDIQAMDNAIDSNNVEGFMNYVTFEENAALEEKSFFTYIKDNEWESVKNQYLTLLEKDKRVSIIGKESIQSIYGNALFEVKPVPHIFGLFKTFEIHAVPIAMLVSSSMDATKVVVGDVSKTVGANKPAPITLIYPGTYTVIGSAENMYGEFLYEDTIEVSPQKEIVIDIEFSGYTYSLNTNLQGANLFINGEDTGKTLLEVDHIGPVPEDSDIKLHAEWESPAGIRVKSEVVSISNNDYYGIPFYFDESELFVPAQQTASMEGNMDSVGEHVLQFRDAYEDAVNFKDYDLISPYLETDSPADKELKIYIRDLKDTDYQYDFTLNEVVDIEQLDDDLFEVTTNEQFTFTNHLDEKLDYDRTKKYKVHVIDNEYKINKIEYVETNREKK